MGEVQADLARSYGVSQATMSRLQASSGERRRLTLGSLIVLE
jgi:DNA-binding Xre family transcriptional regulator